jgi:hypothetical protein
MFLAFVPSVKEMKKPWVKHLWRFGIISTGFLWSLLLWHQQALTDLSAKAANTKLLSDAIAASNTHSDQKIDAVGAGINAALGRAAGNIDTHIGKMAKPLPLKYAKILFSFNGPAGITTPFKEEALRAEADGSYTFVFMFRNISAVPAEDLDVFVRLCQSCRFVREPPDFDRTAGAPIWESHLKVPLLNAGVGYGFVVVNFRSIVSLDRYPVSFMSTCRNCGELQQVDGYSLLVRPRQ